MQLKKDWLPTLYEAHPWLEPIPFQIKGIAIKEACEAISRVIKKLKANEKAQAQFRSRHDAIQSCFIPSSAIKQDGIYPRLSGKGLRYRESLPDTLKDSRLICQFGQWFLSIPIAVQQRLNSVRGENQARVVAIDPGVRTFATFFSEDSCGHIGEGDFQCIYRYLLRIDALISKASKSNSRLKRKLNTRVIPRLRARIENLVNELHWKAANFFVKSFDVILLPTFESKSMSAKADRKIRSQTVRSLLTWAHYKFKQRIKQKAAEFGKVVVDVNEAYTSKTVSWTGEIKQIGGAKTIKSGDVIMDRDLNGARGIFLRALVDTPWLKSLCC